MIYTLEDLKDIQEKEYLLSDESILLLIDQCKDIPFTDKIDKICQAIIEAYNPELPEGLPFDQNLREQVKIELLVQSLNILSACSTSHLRSVAQFIKDSKIKDIKTEQKSVVKATYKSQKSIDPLLKDLTVFKIDNPLRFNSVNFHTTPYYYRLGKFFLDSSPLHAYMLEHIFTVDHPLFDLFVTEEGISSKSKYLFSEEGRYFLAVILRATFSGDIPYTTKTEEGISLQAINKLFNTLYYVYNKSNELELDALEKILFLINSENIFHMSFTRKVFETLTALFNTFTHIAALGFKRSLCLIHELDSCPLNTLQIALWNFYAPKLFESYASPSPSTPKDTSERILYIPGESGQSIFEQMSRSHDPIFCDCLPDIKEMIDCFYFILFSSYDCFDSINTLIYKMYPQDDDCLSSTSEENAKQQRKDHINNLKNDILGYLESRDKDTCPWSAFNYRRINKDEKTGKVTISIDYEPVPSIFNDLFNFMSLYTIFYTVTPTTLDFHSYMSEVNTDYGITRFLRFLMLNKKNKSNLSK